MLKRKSEDEEDKRKKKIRKLERRLERYRSKDVAVVADEIEAIIESPAVVSNEEVDNTPDPEIEPDLVQVSESVADPEFEADSIVDPVGSLPTEVLLALGEDSAQQKGYGTEVHQDILKKVDGILLQGLPKEQKETLMKTCMIPSNALLLDAPKLNNELIAILNANTKSRDKLLEGRQQELGLAAAGVIYAIDGLSRNDFDRINIIKTLGESSRLLCNLHSEYTNLRKKLISPYMDKSLSLNLKENTRSDFLYTKLEDTVKSVSVMKRAGNMLKPKNVVPSTSKNFYQPPRRPFQGPQSRAPTRGGYQQLQPRYQPTHAYRPPPPPRGPARRLPPPAAAPARGRAKYP